MGSHGQPAPRSRASARSDGSDGGRSASPAAAAAAAVSSRHSTAEAHPADNLPDRDDASDLIDSASFMQAGESELALERASMAAATLHAALSLLPAQAVQQDAMAQRMQEQADKS